MREAVFSYGRGNYYLADGGNTVEFGEEKQVCLVMEPCDYELKLSGETLRKDVCQGYRVEVTHKGGVQIFGQDGRLLIRETEGTAEYEGIRLDWSDGALTLQFGHWETVDRYPNCDGEFDRWSKHWAVEYIYRAEE